MRTDFLCGWAAACVLATACSGAGSGGGPQQQAPAVDVARPVVHSVTEWDEYTGRVAAVDEVEVRARVGGYVDSVNFREGSIVEVGQLLYVIDPRPFEAALQEAQAQVQRSEIQLELAISDLDRAKRLYGSRAISEEELDARTQARKEAVAALAAARAALVQAELDLEFSRVTAPIRGRVGADLVSVGNLVSGGTASSTLLTTIVSIDPVHVYFTADEGAFLKYQRLDRQGVRASSRDTANPVRLQLVDEDGFPHLGRMDFVDNRIDESTGTIRGRAVFDNPEGLLIPGLFGRVQLLGRGPYDALLIPDSAIVADQSDRFVYVVGDDDSVSRRPIRLGRLVDALRIVDSGLEADERIVVAGVQRVQPGVTVAASTVELEPPQTDVARQAMRLGE